MATNLPLAMGPPLLALTIIGLQVTTTSVVVGFTNPQSHLRYAALSLTTALAYSQFSYIEHIRNHVCRSFSGAASIFLIILYIDLALLSRWTFEAKGPTSSIGGQTPVKSGQNELESDSNKGKSKSREMSSALCRLRFGFNVSLQSRFPGTNWPVKNIPPFSYTDPNYVPSRTGFLAVNIANCFLYISILRMVHNLGNPEENPTLFSSERVPLISRLGSVSRMEMSTRVLGVVGYWTIQYIVINLLYSFLAVTAVSLRISDVGKWPPVFGRLEEAWSIRQFWGCFYHQLIRRGCGSIARCITYPCLHLEKHSFLARYVFMFLVFAVSGVFHFLGDIAQGICGHESGAMHFFCTQALGIMFEDMAQALLRRLVGAKPIAKFGFFTRTVGYIWLVAWLTWTSPIWIYPAMQRDKGEPIVPF